MFSIIFEVSIQIVVTRDIGIRKHTVGKRTKENLQGFNCANEVEAMLDVLLHFNLTGLLIKWPKLNQFPFGTIIV